MEMKKGFAALSSVLAVGIFLFTCQTGKANADMGIDENVYAIEESCLGSGMKLTKQKESLAIHTLEEMIISVEQDLRVSK
jgi:hypothetical protein